MTRRPVGRGSTLTLIDDSDLWRGALVGGTLRVTAWRCARAEVPADPAAAAAWLFEQWRRLDAWVASSRG